MLEELARVPAFASRGGRRRDARERQRDARRRHGMTMVAERTILEQQLWEKTDPDLDAARTELIRSDQERTPVELAVGVHAASAAAMQNQHVADDVNAAARRAYLGITDDVSAKLVPFDRFVVVDVLTQVARCVPACDPACSHPSCRCLQVEQGTIYFFKVQIADTEFIQLRVFLSLFGDAPQLVALRTGVEAAGPLQCFDV